MAPILQTLVIVTLLQVQEAHALWGESYDAPLELTDSLLLQVSLNISDLPPESVTMSGDWVDHIREGCVGGKPVGSVVKGAKREMSEDAVMAPNVVIFGIGDSGTRGVKSMTQHLGVAMCSDTNHAEDNIGTMPAQCYTPELLTAANGSFTSEAYMSSDVFEEAVQAELAGAQTTHDCIVTEMNDSLGIGLKWGYKNPKHTYLMPVMDAAFQNQQHMLVVARDFRDVCTGDNRGQYLAYSAIVLGEDCDGSFEQCMRFVSSVWTSVLRDYADNENLRIVRIEDLVMPDPKTSSTSKDILKSMMEFSADIQPSEDRLEVELEEAHAHQDSYMGNRFNSTERKSVEAATASLTVSVHGVMRALGYNTQHYGLLKPTHPLVLIPQVV